MNNIYFVNKGIEHLYNRYNISFSSRNKLFKHLRKTYRKFKIIFDVIFKAFDVIFEIDEISISFEKSVAFIINNIKIIIIIHFIVELRDVIIKSGYNFRN